MVAISVKNETTPGHAPVDKTPSGSHGPSLDFAVGWMLALVGMVIGSRTIKDNSFLTHFTTGDLIRVLGEVPSVDSYSYTAGGEPWTVQSWLPSLIYSILADLGGGTAIRMFNGLVVGVVVFMLWQLTGPARPLVARLAIIGPVIVIGSSQWTPRPLLFGLIGFTVVLQVLQERRSLYWLLPVMWLWANSHGSFPLAFVLIGTFGFGQMLDQRLVEGGRWKLPTWELRVFGWAFLGLVGALINPVGPRLLIFPVQLLRKREALNGVAEWLSPNFDSVPEWLFLGLLVALILTARAGVKWRVLLPGIVFAVAGLLAMRNVGVASMVVMVALAPSCQFKGSLRGHEQGFLPRALLGVAAAGALVMPVMVSRTAALSFELYPVEEIDWLEERGLIAQPDVNIIQRDFVGNYMHYRFGQDARVFVDDRFDFFPQQVLEDHLTFVQGGDFAEALERYDTNVVLWRNTGGFAAWLKASTAWTIVYESEDWLIALPAE